MDKHKKTDAENQEEKCTCGESCECHENADLNYQTNLEEKVLEYVQTAQRLQAEFDNFRKNAQTRIADARYDGMTDAITKFLPALDSIAGAKKMIADEKLLEGFLMIENQLLNAFSSLGVEKIEAVGKQFDPKLHNALALQNNPDAEDDTVLEEYQAGYKLNEKIIRYSQVIVNKKEE